MRSASRSLGPAAAWVAASCLAIAAVTPSAARAADAELHPFPKRQRAPEFKPGLRWLNTEKPLTIESLRGKFVVLDFWTYCCINCMHILPELAKLEQAYPNQVVVIGVHSAKFDGEKLDDNVRQAVLRHRIAHPVVNDADHAIWDAYAVTSWPSIRIIDPEGNFIAGESGELQFEMLDRFLKDAIPHYRMNGTLDETPRKFATERLETAGVLRFPGKVVFDEATARLFIADSGNDRIVVAKVDPAAPARGTIEAVIGSGRTGRDDGDFDSATFNHPQGLAVSGQGVLWIADTENHLLRRADLATRTVKTVAGTGAQAHGPWPGTKFDPARRQLVTHRPDGRYVGDPAKTPLNSPWDLCIHGGAVYVAMAGPHQIWRMPLDASEIGPYAGNGLEDVVDGKLLPKVPYQEGTASFAQPSGLATDGERLFVADSEGSSIRVVPLADAKGMVRGAVRTVVGSSGLERARLFTFGDVDGDAATARFQHPLGVAWNDGTIYVADTYNGKVKAIDAARGVVRTVAGGESADDLDEPAGIAFGAGRIWVADTNHHRIVVVNPADGSMETVELSTTDDPPKPEITLAAAEAEERHLTRPKAEPVRAAPVRVAPHLDADGIRTITITVTPEPPKGWKLNELMPLKWEIEAIGEAGPVGAEALRHVFTVAKPKESFPVTLPLDGIEGSAELLLLVETGVCSVGAGECRPVSTATRIPVTIASDGRPTGEVKLPLPKVAGGGGIPGLELFR